MKMTFLDYSDVDDFLHALVKCNEYIDVRVQELDGIYLVACEVKKYEDIEPKGEENE